MDVFYGIDWTEGHHDVAGRRRGMAEQGRRPDPPSDPREILGAAPTPAMAAELPMWKLRLMMTNAGRQRGINEDAEPIHTLFR